MLIYNSNLHAISFSLASLRLTFLRIRAASSQCFLLVGYSLPVSSCFTLELVINTTICGSFRGINSDVKLLEVDRIINYLQAHGSPFTCNLLIEHFRLFPLQK